MFKSLVAGSAFLIAGGVGASGSPFMPPPDPQPHIVFVSGGCGLAFHRNPYGDCVPNREVIVRGVPYVRLPPPCPRGYHRDPDPARRLCYPNF